VDNQPNDKSDFGRTNPSSRAYATEGMAGSEPYEEDSYEDLASEAERGVSRAAAGIRDQFNGIVDYFNDKGVQEVMDDVTGYVKSHPAQALIGAAVIGFFVGRIARRS